MNILKYFLLFIFFWTNNLSYAQIKHYDFNILAYGGIGFGVIENKSDPNYNVNSSNTEILVKYRVTHKLGIATGIGLTELTGNGFNNSGNFHHERMLLKFPLTAILDYTISEQFSVIPNLGLYSQYIIKDEYQLLNVSQKNIYEGWNFGAQLGVGLVYKLFKGFSTGFQYGFQYDFNHFSSNKSQMLVSDKQKLGKMTTVGIILVLEL